MHWVLFLAIAAVAVQAQFTVKCTRKEACFPFDLTSGPHCARGDNMNMRFSIDLAEENQYERYGQNNSAAAYAGCPVVDELQAINLTNSGRYAATIVNNESDTNNTFTNFSETQSESWVRVYGFGGNDDIGEPNSTTSDGAAMIYQNETRNICSQGTRPFVNFLVLSVTMSSGKFAYSSSYNQPFGVGFTPTCDSGGTCLLDSTLACIGRPGRQNCARCLTAHEMSQTNTQVWVSYEGTDRLGKPLLSGGNNPLNFRAYAGTSVFSSVSTSIGNLRSGNINNDPVQP